MEHSGLSEPPAACKAGEGRRGREGFPDWKAGWAAWRGGPRASQARRVELQSYLIPHVHADRAGLPRLLQTRPAGEGRTSEAGPGAGHWSREGTREPQSHPEAPRVLQEGGSRHPPTRLATNTLSFMSQTPRWERAAPEAELGGLRGWWACRRTLMHAHAHVHTHTVTRTHVHGPDTILHYPGPQCHQLMHRLELATSGWGACDREGTEGRPLLHFLTHNCPLAPLLQGEPRGWATGQPPVVTSGCAGPLSQGPGLARPWMKVGRRDGEHGAELGPEQQASGCLHVHRAHAGRDGTGPLRGSGLGSAHFPFAFCFCLCVVPRPRPTPQSRLWGLWEDAACPCPGTTSLLAPQGPCRKWETRAESLDQSNTGSGHTPRAWAPAPAHPDPVTQASGRHRPKGQSKPSPGTPRQWDHRSQRPSGLLPAEPLTSNASPALMCFLRGIGF